MALVRETALEDWPALREIRLAALQDLGSLAGRARSAAEAAALVGEALTQAAADVPFAAIYLRRPGTDEIALAATIASIEPGSVRSRSAIATSPFMRDRTSSGRVGT